MSRPDEGLIHAWLDGELEPAEASRVERLVAEDAEWAAAVAEARGFMAASGRILSALDHVPGDVLPAGSARMPARRPLASRPWVRIAAGIVLVAGVGLAVVSDESSVPPVTSIARDAEPAIAQVDQPTIAAPSPAGVAAPRSAGVVAAPPDERLGVGQTRADTSAAPPPASQSRERALADVAAPPPEVEATTTAVPTAAPPAVSRAAAEVEERAMASRLSRREAAAGAQAFSAAAKALSVQALEGCWRAHTEAGADSLLSTPRVLRSVGDTLVIDAGPASRPARVARVGTDTLRGEMADAAGRAVPFSAVRTECAAPATPSPRR